MTSETTASQPVIPTAYTFTISPSDTYQHFGSPVRLRQCTDDIRILLNRTIGNKFEYILATEVSYPDVVQDHAGGRIHYHGIIYFRPGQRAEFYIEYINKLANGCRIEIDTIKDINKWLIYIYKDRDEMERFCAYSNVPYLLHHHLPMPMQPTEISNDGIKQFIKTKNTKQRKPIED